MEQWITGIGAAASFITSCVFWIFQFRRTGKKSQRFALPGTIFVALSGLLFMMWWLHHVEPTTGRIEALKAGGLVSTAIIALYALWLNDRRRRAEEERINIEEKRREIERERHQLETRKADHDQQRVGNEHFVKAIELLGNPADQVRVGAMHALHGLALSEPLRTQTVLDVLCAYLRRPFTHLTYISYENPSSFDSEDEYVDLESSEESPTVLTWSEEKAAMDRERQVRLTAQRLIERILQKFCNDAALDLDLTGAVLEDFTLRRCNIGHLVLQQAVIYLDMVIAQTRIEHADFEEARFPFGELQFEDTKVSDDLNLRLVQLAFKLRMNNVEIGGDLIMGGAELRYGGFIGATQLDGDFNCRAWLGSGLKLHDFAMMDDKKVLTDPGTHVRRDSRSGITNIYDPETLKDNNLPDPSGQSRQE